MKTKGGGLTKVRTIAKVGHMIATKIFLKIVHYLSDLGLRKYVVDSSK